MPTQGETIATVLLSFLGFVFLGMGVCMYGHGEPFKAEACLWYMFALLFFMAAIAIQTVPLI